MLSNLPPKSSVVAIYARVSSDKQADLKTPIQSQINELKAFAQKEGWQLYRVFKDEARTGTNSQRPAFREIVDLAKQKPPPFQAILVWKFSRFALNREDSIVYKSLLQRRGVNIISYKEPMPEGPIGALLEGIIEAVDEFYSRNLGQDTLRGCKEIARQGFWPAARPPVGYMRQRVQVGTKSDGKPLMTTTLVPDPETAPRVLRAFKMAAKGYSFHQIAKETQICADKSSLPTIFSNET